MCALVLCFLLLLNELWRCSTPMRTGRCASTRQYWILTGRGNLSLVGRLYAATYSPLLHPHGQHSIRSHVTLFVSINATSPSSLAHTLRYPAATAATSLPLHLQASPSQPSSPSPTSCASPLCLCQVLRPVYLIALSSPGLSLLPAGANYLVRSTVQSRQYTGIDE